jgi:hypothetical protein
MKIYALGFVLMIAGAVLFFLQRRPSQARSVQASGGSVAVGGHSTAPITNVNVESHNAHGGHALTVLAIFVELVGIGVVIWHAWHLAAK